MVSFLYGQQKDFTKYPRFLCMWNSRALKKHWSQKESPIRDTLAARMLNIMNEPFVSHDRIILIFFPFQIKLGMMEQFLKSLNTDDFLSW